MSKDKDSQRVCVLHHCDKTTLIGQEDGTVRSVQPVLEGETIPPETEIVDFEDCGEPGFVNMKTICRTPGPAKVNSIRFKAGWDAIFAKPKPASSMDMN